MPTFTNPTADADEAHEALRGLAHASRVFEDPADTYPVIGDLLAAVRSLRQVMDQLATVHLTHRHQVTDEAREYAGGAVEALAAADELHQAASLIDQAHDRLNAAMTHSGRIVWNPGTRLLERWIGVVFLQGEDADRVLDLIDQNGVEAGIEHLSGWDYGQETTDAAMVNGDVHDAAPVYAGDRQAETGDYTLTYNPQAGHVALYRRHLIPEGDALDPDDQPDTARTTAPSAAPGGPARDRDTTGRMPPPGGTRSGRAAGSSRTPSPRSGRPAGSRSDLTAPPAAGVHLPGMTSTDPTPAMSWQAGTLALTVWPDAPVGEHQRYAYRIEDTETAQAVEGRDLFTGAGAPVAPGRAMRDLTGYLSAAGDARQYVIDHHDASPEHAGLFPAWVAEAARRNADALTLLADEPNPILPGIPDPHLAESAGSRPSLPEVSPWFTRPEGGTAPQSRGRSL